MLSPPTLVALVDDTPRDKNFAQLALATVKDIRIIAHQARHSDAIASLIALEPDVPLLDVLPPRTASADTTVLGDNRWREVYYICR